MEEEVAISSRHFFNVMVPAFHNHLDLPPSFCKKLKDEKSKRAILRSRKGNWKMDVCRDSEGLICFKNGWPRFVDHHGLSIGYFLVFEHIGDFHFNVSIFDHTACGKEFLVEPKKAHQEPPEVALNHDNHPKNAKRESDKATAISYGSANPHFVLTMKPSFAEERPGVNISAEFLRSNDLRHKSSITLRDPHRRAWPVKLRLVKTDGRSRPFMCKGWQDFYVANELKSGDVCVFELNHRSLQSTTDALIDVQISCAPV